MQTSRSSRGGENARCEGHAESEVHHLVPVLIQGYEGGHEKAVYELDVIILGAFCYFAEMIVFESCIILDFEISMVRTSITDRRLR